MTDRVQYTTVNGRMVKQSETVDGEQIAVPVVKEKTARYSTGKTAEQTCTTGENKE